mmetsp:Transcript_18753/g.18072  ORF Transcript_18753/g.18072 Transcript_18753/m.18072 type:complete len:224 (-) Transcript_18753:94-765(-)
MAQEADDEIIQQQQRIKAIAESIERLTIASKEDIIVQKRNASTDILTKYTALVYPPFILPLRGYAAQAGLGRPWDGLNGVTYLDWKKRFYRGGPTPEKTEGDDEDEAKTEGSDSSDDSDAEDRIINYNTVKIRSAEEALRLSRQASGNMLVQMRIDAEKKKNQRIEERDNRVPVEEDEGPGGLEPEYNWDDTNMMNIYNCPLYDEFKATTERHHALFGESSLK